MKPQDVTISNYLVEPPYTRFLATLWITRISPVCITRRPVLNSTWAAQNRCWAAGFPPRKPEFNPRVDHMRSVLHIVASFLKFPLPIITSSIDHIHLSSKAGTTRHWRSQETSFTLQQYHNYEQMLFRVAPRLVNLQNLCTGTTNTWNRKGKRKKKQEV
jgi:hypothetical protein